MNIEINRKRLLPALNLICGVVEKKQTLPILANVYFNLEKGRLKLIGTDLEVEISTTINEVEGDDGSFTLSSRKILDISRMLPEKSVISIEHDSGYAVVSSGRSRYTLKTLEAKDFPRIEAEENWEERFKIRQADLKSLVDKTSFAMAVDDVRYYLNGVLFELDRNTLRATTTDGHRLAQTAVDISLDASDVRQIIIPRKAIAEINRFLGAEEGQGAEDETELTVEISKNHLKLSKGEKILITKLIDGKFPEFKGVFETEINAVIRVNSAMFIETMTRAAILAAGVKMVMEPGVMKITGNNQEQEEAVEELEIDYSGEPVETGYNVTYLIDVARVIGTEEMALHLQGNEGICIIKAPGDERSTWLVMPMRI